MPLQVQCPCGKRLQIPDSAAGKKVKCPNCQTLLAIQAPVQAAEVVEDEFEVVEEPKPKPAAKKPIKALSADDDDDDDDDRPKPKSGAKKRIKAVLDDDADDEDDEPKSKSKSKSSLLLKGIKAAAVSNLGGRPDVDDEDEDEEEDEDDDEPRSKKKKGKKSKKRKRKSDEDDEDSAYWKTPQGMMLNGLGLIGLGGGGIGFYFVEEAPRPIGLLIAGILCIGFGIGSIITGYTKQSSAKDDDE